ncbi:hypothetical protein MCHI_001449 [Candidatus Magnetoovum chiemensis]|nr:hypothetical protein MCHI_001449 [Candidatus Magnetoovum chiemensis]
MIDPTTTLGAIGSVCSIWSVIPEQVKKPIYAELNEWSKEANVNNAMAREVFFEQKFLKKDPSSYPAHQALLLSLSTQEIPSKDLWFDSLLESWNERHETLGDKAGDFFKDEATANPYLDKLAVRLEKVYSTNADYFRYWVYNTLIQSLNKDAGDKNKRYAALAAHHDYLRRLYEEEPALGKQRFSLSDVYVDTECGCLTWKEIDAGNNKEKIDPFNEKNGGRHNLLTTVMAYIEDPTFNEMIVIQGVAGSGKSSFTLRLCMELARKGINTIRIRLKLMDFDKLDPKIHTAISRSIEPPKIAKENLIINDLFEEKMPNKEEVCPYVLIFDGWDEITIGASEGFKQRVEKILNRIRNQFIERRNIPVRVIITGRPSEDVFQAGILKNDTPILTIRPMRPDQLRNFGEMLKNALNKPPAAQTDGEKNKCTDEDIWTLDDLTTYETIFSRYENYFSQYQTGSKPEDSSMDVLSLPLLAFLAYRLFAEMNFDQINELLENPTTLYRKLVDLTCQKSGKAHCEKEDAENHKIHSKQLRCLLQYTAAMINTVGEEHISHDELKQRLELEIERSPELKNSLIRILGRRS